MAKLMWICGILLVAAGVALGLVVLVSVAPPAVSFDTAAILLVGGILAVGLGSAIDALHQQRTLPIHDAVASAVPPPASIPEFGPRPVKVAAVSAAAAETAHEVSEPTRETIKALEQARQKIEQAFDGKRQDATRPTTPPPPEAEVQRPEPRAALQDAVVDEEEAEAEDAASEDEESMDADQLYVIEERVIRRRPARILSDGTVEAETDEGWMRFENLEHLDEYLDATDETK